MKIDKTRGMMMMGMLFLLLCSMRVFAVIDMRMDVRPEFFIGDTVSFNYIIDSNVRETITYSASVKCLDAPTVVSDVKTATLEQDVPLIGEHIDFVVAGSVRPQECTASLTILEPIQNSISKNFNIRATGQSGVIKEEMSGNGSSLFFQILIVVIAFIILGVIFYLFRKNKKS